MPDLSMKAVHEFWHQFQDKDVYRAIAFLEGVEDWTVDGDPEFEAAIQEMGTELDNIGTIEAGKLADMVAVKGDPIADIKEMQYIDFVMKDGKVYLHK